MAAFELNDTSNTQGFASAGNCNSCGELDPNRLREENIIAFKLYDSCRHLHGNNLRPPIHFLSKRNYNTYLKAITKI